MKGWRTLGVALLVPALAGSASGQEAGEEATRAFDRVYEEFSRAYRDGDPAGVTALYTPDAFYLAPGDSIARGGVDRHFGWLASFEAGQGPVIEFEIVDRQVAGDLAYDIGYYTIRAADAPAGGGSRGKFIVIWKRAEGAWRIHADGYSEVRDDEEGE